MFYNVQKPIALSFTKDETPKLDVIALCNSE